MFVLGCFLVFSSASTAQPLEIALKIKPFATSHVPKLKIPHRVRGVVVTVKDKLVRTISISWQPNSPQDKTDEYAIYREPAIGFSDPGELIGITKATKIGFRTWIPSPFSPDQPKDSLQVDPTIGVEIWVIAHNKFGWGVNANGTTSPDGRSQASISDDQIESYFPEIADGWWACSKAFEKFYGVSCTA